MRSDLTQAWVYEACGRVLGHLLSQVVADEAELHRVAVLHTARRRGIGRSLVLGAIDAWGQSGVRVAWLEVRSDNRPALELYLELGWRVQGRRRAYYRDGSDAVVMRKTVTPGGR